jgi:hypothetical protein
MLPPARGGASLIQENAMPTTRTVVTLTLIAAAVSGTILAAIDVHVSHDKTFDFKPARTYTWEASGPGNVRMGRTMSDNPESMRRWAEPIIYAVGDDVLADGGLTKTTTSPDLTIRYFLLLTTNVSAQTLGQFLPPTPEWGVPPFAAVTQSLKLRNRGALVLDVSAKGNTVWRGVAQGDISIDAGTEKRERTLRDGVRALLRKLPGRR